MKRSCRRFKGFFAIKTITLVHATRFEHFHHYQKMKLSCSVFRVFLFIFGFGALAGQNSLQP